MWLAESRRITRHAARTLIDAGLVTVDGRPGRPGQRVRDSAAVVVTPPVAPDSVAESRPGSAGKPAVGPEDRRRGRVAGGRRQAVRHGRPSRSGPSRRDPCRRAQGAGDHLVVARWQRSGRGSSTASTATRAACWWLRRPRARTDTWPGSSAIARSVAPTGRSCTAASARTPGPSTRRSPVTLATAGAWRSSREVARRSPTFACVERLSGATVLEVSLRTGRTHQIRVHLASIGHPIVGDARLRSSRPDPRPSGAARRAAPPSPSRRRDGAVLRVADPRRARRRRRQAPSAGSA